MAEAIHPDNPNLRRSWLSLPTWQAAVIGLGDVLCLMGAIALAFLLRFEGFTQLGHELSLRPLSLVLSLLTYLVLFSRLRLYTCAWRFASLDILFAVVQGTFLGTVALLVWQYMLDGTTFPRSVLILTWLLSMFLVGATRISLRLLNQGLLITDRLRRNGRPRRCRRLLIVGAGDLGAELVKRLRQHPELGYEICGLIDDDPLKYGSHLYGKRILGSTRELRLWLDELQIDEVILALPEWATDTVRTIVDECSRLGVTAKTLPTTRQLLNRTWDLRDIRKIDVEDLLHRDPVRVDTTEIASCLANQVVLVTGAGGSIGSELCRQVIRFNPKLLIAFDHEETSMFQLEQELRQEKPAAVVEYLVGDVRNVDRLREAFQRFQPNILFHAAAYKHVPVMENNPGEAIRNNILGTRLAAQCADEFGTQRFILVSTDKAVNPTSVMGATKRAAELLIQLFNARSETKFMAVRFGNVLASRGSVVPIFRKQIDEGGPVTVTDPEMKRYFMTIPEAVQLVLQAGALGEGGEIFVLDMGEPVKIVELARDLIRLCGFEPDRDIKIEFVGTRPGEKLCEELQMDGEEYMPTSHRKIFVAKPENGLHDDEFHRQLDKLCQLASNGGTPAEFREGLRGLVPSYEPHGAADAGSAA